MKAGRIICSTLEEAEDVCMVWGSEGYQWEIKERNGKYVAVKGGLA